MAKFALYVPLKPKPGIEGTQISKPKHDQPYHVTLFLTLSWYSLNNSH